MLTLDQIKREYFGYYKWINRSPKLTAKEELEDAKTTFEELVDDISVVVNHNGNLNKLKEPK